jgi:hypothetical protein
MRVRSIADVMRLIPRWTNGALPTNPSRVERPVVPISTRILDADPALRMCHSSPTACWPLAVGLALGRYQPTESLELHRVGEAEAERSRAG